MTVASCLRGARALLRTGWAEPFSIDERGAAGATLKTAEKTSFNDAIFWSAADNLEYLDAWNLVEATACPSAAALNALARRPEQLDATACEAARIFAARYDGHLQDWLEKKYRTIDQVFTLIDRALVRTLKG